MDTNERFTRVYGSYPNNVITGTRDTNANSKYVQMSTFSINVPVSLPAGIQHWAPLITYATSRWVSSNATENNIQIDAISYAVFTNAYYPPKGNYLNISDTTAYALTGGQVITQNPENGVFLPPPTSALDYKPKVSAEAWPGPSPSVRLYYTYLAGIASKDGGAYARLWKSERRATISFVIVGY